MAFILKSHLCVQYKLFIHINEIYRSMKLNIQIFLTVVVLLFVAYSCSDTVSYADQLKAEQSLISNYIARNHIKVVTKMPTTFPWPDNVYYKGSSGMYFRLINKGDSIFDGDTIRAESGDLIVTRYVQYTLAVVPDSISSWNTVAYAYPSQFIYGNAAQVSSAWQEAVSYMKYNNSEAKLIVPSKLNFSKYSESVTPIGYNFKILVQQN